MQEKVNIKRGKNQIIHQIEKVNILIISKVK